MTRKNPCLCGDDTLCLEASAHIRSAIFRWTSCPHRLRALRTRRKATARDGLFSQFGADIALPDHGAGAMRAQDDPSRMQFKAHVGASPSDSRRTHHQLGTQR